MATLCSELLQIKCNRSSSKKISLTHIKCNRNIGASIWVKLNDKRVITLLKKVEIDFNKEINILVGPNEAGKSTLLEAINLALTGQINGRSVSYDLRSYLFNVDCVGEYIEKLKSGEAIEPPSFLKWSFT